MENNKTISLLGILKEQLIGKKIKLIGKKEGIYQEYTADYQRDGKTISRTYKKRLGNHTIFKIVNVIDIEISYRFYDNDQDEISLKFDDETSFTLYIEQELELIDPVLEVYMITRF